MMDAALRRSSTRRRRALSAAQVRTLRIAGWTALGVLAVLPLLWVLFFAPTTGKFATSFGSAVHDPKDFTITVLNGVTAAGLYFVVASGFTLIFGLMRVVNMAHGAFFLLGGYVALRVQRDMVGGGGSFGLTSAQVNLTHWIIPTLAGTALVAAAGHRAVGQFHAAMDACYQALAILPSDPDIHLLLAELYLDRGWRGPAADKLVLLGRLAQLTGDGATRARLCYLAAARFPDDPRLAAVCA